MEKAPINIFELDVILKQALIEKISNGLQSNYTIERNPDFIYSVLEWCDLIDGLSFSNKFISWFLQIVTDMKLYHSELSVEFPFGADQIDHAAKKLAEKTIRSYSNLLVTQFRRSE